MKVKGMMNMTGHICTKDKTRGKRTYEQGQNVHRGPDLNKR